MKPDSDIFIGNFVYENNVLSYMLFEEGRIVFTGGLQAEYYLKDHLGNTRVNCRLESGVLKTRQVNSYYPFCMNIKELSANSTDTYKPNEYLYNGKMMQDEMGLGWLDYGARFYDAVLARWHSPDPLAEITKRWSPYNYCYNNPLGFVDPSGMHSGSWSADQDADENVQFGLMNLGDLNEKSDRESKTDDRSNENKTNDSQKDPKKDTQSGKSDNKGVEFVADVVGILNLSSGAVLVFVRENASSRVVYYSIDAAKKWISTSSITKSLEFAGKWTFYIGTVNDILHALQDHSFIGKAAANTAIYGGSTIISGPWGWAIGGGYMILDKLGAIDALGSGIKMPETHTSTLIQQDNTLIYNTYKQIKIK